MVEYGRLPIHMREGMKRYIEHGIDPGGFARACLENRFVEAVAKADAYNELALKDWALWLYNECPSDAWGNSAKVVEYMERKRKEAANDPAGNEAEGSPEPA